MANTLGTFPVELYGIVLVDTYSGPYYLGIRYDRIAQSTTTLRYFVEMPLMFDDTILTVEALLATTGAKDGTFGQASDIERLLI